jgi:tRNA threonylcarbamoyladenosine modification (KEOPS) complex  Pcc1 subunit
MSAQDIADMKAAIETMRVTVRWLVWAVGILALVHGPEILKIISEGP